MGLTISTKKMKVLAVHPAESNTEQLRDVFLRPGGLVSVVDYFEYLGRTITKDCSLEKEINVRISKASLS